MLTDTPINILPHTSPLTIKHLKSLQIETYFDFLEYFPFRYENYSLITPVRAIQEGEIVTVKGTIVKVKNEYTRRGFKLQKVSIRDSSGELEITWYNQPYLLHVFKVGLPLSVAGEVVRFAGRLTIAPKEWEILKTDHIHTGRIIPIYSEVRGLSTRTIREKMFHVVKHLENLDEPQESLPPHVLAKYHLKDLHSSYVQIHFPQNITLLKESRRRMGFDELLTIQLSSLLTKKEWEKKTVSFHFKPTSNISKKVEDFITELPFELTQDQKAAVEEIRQDLSRHIPMNRFLQGDVGSGKTVVAAIASYISYLNGCRTLIMAPTEILAQQHYQTLMKLFGKTKVRVSLQTSSRKDLAKDSTFDIAVGTQALLSDSIHRGKIGLVIIDEQHRFGVAQRAMLKSKSGEPHLLTMTATPIPRTLALTLYGELDLSSITQMPQGRLPVKTYLVPSAKRMASYEWIREKVKKQGAQVFVICPLIEESDVETLLTVKAAKKEYENLKTKIFPDLRVALLHGKLKSSEKTAIMKDFSEGKSDILVSTSVVEVGIDIPNASIMIIEEAHKFGLAQLHQLRGRVGRGSTQSYCYLFSDIQEEGSLRRLAYFTNHNKGVDLAEYDLHHRGPGNIFGTNQHGFMKLRVAQLSDIELIKESRFAAALLLSESPDLEKYPKLASQISHLRMKEVARD